MLRNHIFEIVEDLNFLTIKEYYLIIKKYCLL